MPSFEIHPLDLNFLGTPEAIAAYLILGPGGPVLVECGPGSTLATLQAGLQRFNLTPADIRDLLVTHIHLDHAGAAGWLARQGARVHVHHIGAPHLLDPSKLLASAQRIYGEMMDTLWGEFLSVPAEQLRVHHDNDVIEAGGLQFIAHDTPGHATHHFVYQLEDVAFTGDLAGIRLSGRPYLRMPTPPPEFDLAAWQSSLRRIRALPLTRLYLTHFGAVDNIDHHWANVALLLKSLTAEVGQRLAEGADREALIAYMTALENSRQLTAELDAEARQRYANIGPVGMSVDGIIRYWKKQARN